MTAPVGALGVNDAAAYLGVSRRTLYRLSAECGTGALPVVHLRGRRVFRVVDLDRFLAQQLAGAGRRAS